VREESDDDDDDSFGLWMMTPGYCMYVYYYRTYEKAVSGGEEGEKGGHVLRDPQPIKTMMMMSRGLYRRSSLAPDDTST